MTYLLSPIKFPGKFKMSNFLGEWCIHDLLQNSSRYPPMTSVEADLISDFVYIVPNENFWVINVYI